MSSFSVGVVVSIADENLPCPFPMDEQLWQTLSLQLDLSPKQEIIVRLILCGMENVQIAEAMGNKVDTIRAHLKTIYARTQCKNRVALILKIFLLAQKLR